MRNTWAIAWREIRTYFSSPLAYVVIGVFLCLAGYFFWASLVNFSELCLAYGSHPYYSQQLNVNEIVVRPLFDSLGMIFLLMIPAVSMRLLAEERKTGTAELLFTCPVTSGEVILGKFLGAAFLLLVMLGGTVIYPILILGGGAHLDLAPTLIGYLGVLLMSLSFLAIGLLISSLTENQVVAAVGAFGVLLMLWVINWLARSATITLSGAINALTGGLWERVGLGLAGPTLGDLLRNLSIIGHLDDFRKGLLDTQHVIFYLSVSFLALFVTQRVVESRRWR